MIVEQILFVERNFFGKSGSDKRIAVVDGVVAKADIPYMPNFIKRSLIEYFIDKTVWFMHFLVGFLGFKDVNLSDEDIEKVAAVCDVPVDAIICTETGKSLDERLNVLYEKYGVDAEPELPKEDVTAPVDEKWDRCIAFVLSKEGGYGDHPADRGGETNMGITAGTLAAAYAKGLVGHNSVKDLLRFEAEAIYKADFWNNYGFGEIPWPACLVLLDAAVHHGGGGLARLAQRTCNTFGSTLVMDGKWGPLTKAAVMMWSPDDEFSRLFLVKRKDYIDTIISGNKSQEVFRNGWYKRLADLAEEAGVKSSV